MKSPLLVIAGFIGLLAVTNSDEEGYPLTFLEQCVIVAIPALVEGWWGSRHIKEQAQEDRITAQVLSVDKETEE